MNLRRILEREGYTLNKSSKDNLLIIHKQTDVGLLYLERNPSIYVSSSDDHEDGLEEKIDFLNLLNEKRISYKIHGSIEQLSKDIGQKISKLQRISNKINILLGYTPKQ